MDGVFGGSGWLWIILVGFVVGVLARLIKPGKQDIGIILTVVLGIVGALFAGWIGRMLGWYDQGEKVGFIASLIGAVVILFVAEAVNGRRRRR
ncbi:MULTISPECIES: GlsB/YeaQ/YmgE family stress response membrane protein [unclassified Luteimonas]|uniref:GlsB/YeaQ/YmgE family stress response membrane protein n=1 Tax=unclassified Luteimonas TaxID=2629088 RepID=UPI0018F0F3A2|nr:MULTISPECIES: GlsB/YeaQ/YmgE family stress response membrane protein [unclassified Luteimonas]MBJ6978714.1 GlsB/YeaQ/YmgE family stress response membrane protein [Luteimonas sp. MC1895]MBJ6983614.1 GlsB/YeaQ/YmgE family stress response membrane protein [Luteimonas sp. MC1750]QQO06458.1 GlsB/YeaQ/YmgE family stress response membrane protein [Luteimonas sp. MC1750]